jgi:hypothetical protein
MLDNLVVQVDPGVQFPSQYVLELACAAQRVNKDYVKEGEAVYDDKGEFLYIKTTNKMMMLTTVDPKFYSGDPKDQPYPLKIRPEDTEMADTIKSYFRKLMFAAVAGENDFLTTVNSLLNSDTIGHKMFGYVACLPSVYKRDYAKTQLKKQAQNLEEAYLGIPGTTVHDLDCEILESRKSKNFDAYGICAIINNKMVTWFNKTDMAVGPCIIIRGKIKDHSKHWEHGNAVTRLHYVKAAQ